MSQPWTAEEEVDLARARTLVETQFPVLAPTTLRLLGVGWDNSAYLVNDAYVFRFPRRSIAVPLIEREARLLPLVARAVAAPVPQPRFVGRPSPLFRWPFLGHRLVVGRTADCARLGPDARASLAEPLGRFLAGLHGVPVAVAEAAGAGPDELGRLDLPRMRNDGHGFLAHLGAAELPVPRAAIAAALDDVVVEPSCYREPVALVHGDLYARHLLVDEHTGFAGVIDWGDVHIGLPAVDLSVAFDFLPPAARPALFAAYGRPIAPGTLRLARYRALMSALAVAAFARDVGDADLAWEGRQAIAHALA